jgi:hypothetical protein
LLFARDRGEDVSERLAEIGVEMAALAAGRPYDGELGEWGSA